MTKKQKQKQKQKQQYRSPEELKEILWQTLAGKKYFLDCGHCITFGQSLGNDLTLRNGRDFTVICSQCGY